MSLPTTEAVMDFVLAKHRDFRDAERQARPHSTGAQASSLGYCFQRQVRDIREPRKWEGDAKTLRTFSLGDEVESWVRRAYLSAGMVMAPPEDKQWRLHDPDLDLTARMDLLLCWPPQDVSDIPSDIAFSEEWKHHLAALRAELFERHEYVEAGLYALEIKSANSNSMRMRHREGIPSYSHGVQVGAERLLQRLHPEQLPGPVLDWRIEYIGKDYGSVLTFGVPASWEGTAEDRMAVVREHLDSGTPWQDVPCECEGWMVRYCPYRTSAELEGGVATWTCCSGAAYSKKLKAGESL